MVRGLGLVLSGVLAGACASPSFVRTAYLGDLATLKKEIATASASGRIGEAEVVDLAEAVARREVRSAKGTEAVERIHATLSCARTVERELAEWTESAEDAGAEAQIVLIEAGRASAGSFVDRYAHAASGAFRALAARGTTGAARGELRRGFYVDPDERVRRQAFRAGLVAGDAEDLPALMEAARLDPSPENRGLAARAVGAVGGPLAAQWLVDLWATAEDETRLAIVEAWAAPRTFESGGAAELVRVAEPGGSLFAVASAGQLVRIGGEGALIGRGVLTRAVAEGTTDERMLAIQLLPVGDPTARAALQKAAQSDDSAVKAVALARLLELPAEKAKALVALKELSRGEDAAARQARAALVAVGDQSAAPLLERQLNDPDPGRRRQAAVGLFRLGHAGRMAPALSDPDPSVRLSVACSVLSNRAGPG